MWLFFQTLLQINVCEFDYWQIWIKWMKICIKSSKNSIWNFILTENSISESMCLRVIVCRYLVEFYRKMSSEKKQRLPVLPGQKTLFSFVCWDGNNNFDPDDSMRKEIVLSTASAFTLAVFGTCEWWFLGLVMLSK